MQPITKPTLPTLVYKPKPETKPPTSHALPSNTYSPPVKPYMPDFKITVAIDGVILCKHGYNTYPIKGAKAKVVCSYKEGGVMTYSKETEEKGYFHLRVRGAVKDIGLCKVKLHSSPLSSCKNPTDVNNGVNGVPLSPHHFPSFSDRNLKLAPFYFTRSHLPPRPNY